MKSFTKPDKLFIILGKSGTGKDTVYKHLLAAKSTPLCPIVLYTTRPKRPNESDGETYHFVTHEELAVLKTLFECAESRVYNTVHGLWEYATLIDRDLGAKNCVCISTLEALPRYTEVFGKETVVPLYLTVPDKERLERAVTRESLSETPNYLEVCRRYIADENDFSESKLRQCGIDHVFNNLSLDECAEEINSFILSNIMEEV